MIKFFKDVFPVIRLTLLILLAMVVVSYGIYLVDETLAIYFISYILPVFFLILFVSIFKDSYTEK